MEANETIKVAVLEEQMKNLTGVVKELGNKIDGLGEKIDSNYLKKEDFNRFKTDEFLPVQSAYDKLLWWIIGTLLTALGGLLVALINYFSGHH